MVPGADGIDPHALVGQRQRGDAGQLVHAAFRDVVGHLVGNGHDRVHRRHVDDRATALLDHAPGHRLRHQEHALQIDAQHPVEVLFLQLQEVGGLDGPGIVDEDIDTAERLDRGGNHGLDLRLVANIALNDARRATGVSDRPLDIGGGIHGHVGNDHACALGGECLGTGTAYPLRRPGDNNRLVLESHVCSFPVFQACRRADNPHSALDSGVTPSRTTRKRVHRVLMAATFYRDHLL